METKADFRRHVRQEKKKYEPEDLIVRSEAVWQQIEMLPEFQRARVIAAYWSLPDEVFSHDFVEKWSSEKKILLPVMLEDCRLELREYRPGCTMNEAEFCIREPEGEVLQPEYVDLILVPGMAFDRQNHRLGRGKGYYDRLLGGMDALKIGVCFDFQFFDFIPTDEHDIPMDRVIHG